jgi:hypothetical protein
MNTLTKTVLSLAIGIATTAQAQQVIVIEGQREVADPSALIGEDSGSFHLSRQSAATPGMGAVPTDARRSAMSDALVREDSGAAYFASLPLGPGVDRIVVVAELDQARASGQLAALVSEDSGSAWLQRSRSSVTTARIDVGPDLGDRPLPGEAFAAFDAPAN